MEMNFYFEWKQRCKKYEVVSKTKINWPYSSKDRWEVILVHTLIAKCTTHIEPHRREEFLLLAKDFLNFENEVLQVFTTFGIYTNFEKAKINYK